MATVIKTDGTRSDLPNINLGVLQEAVGGLIEAVYLSAGRLMYVNEEGLIIGLEYNPTASAIARRPIVGDVVILSAKEAAADSDGE